MNPRPPGRDDLDLLLDPLIRHAQKELRELDRMWPVGAVLGDDGKVDLIEVEQGDVRAADEQLQDILADVRARAAASDIKAFGVSHDGSVDGLYDDPTAAVTTELEHRLGDSVVVYLNYARTGPGGAVRFGRLMARPRQRTVFSPPAESPGT